MDRRAFPAAGIVVAQMCPEARKPEGWVREKGDAGRRGQLKVVGILPE